MIGKPKNKENVKNGQKFENLEKSREISKNHFFDFSNIRRTGFDQSSPVHPVFESRGGSLSMTGGRTDGRTEILVSNF